MKVRSHRAALLAATGFGLIVTATTSLASPAPQPAPLPPPIAAPQDSPFPGEIELKVDAQDVARRIFFVTEKIPVAQAGDFVLLFPK